MESLIKASENYQAVAKEEETNVEIFNQFMNKITVWDYSSVSREDYLSLPNHEKEAMLCKYYTDMKGRSSGKNFIFVACLVWHGGKYLCTKRFFEK